MLAPFTALTALFTSSIALAQPPGMEDATLRPSTRQAPPPSTAPVPQSPDGLPKLAKRIAAVRAQTTVTPVLVIVPDEPSYYAAIARWHNGKQRAPFPVLIDDGTLPARENIARFARAFKPVRTIRFAAKGEGSATSADTLTATLVASWGAANETAYYAALAARPDAPGPLGATVTDPADPARTAAVALAAAYGQALVFVASPAPANGTITFPAADALTSAITARFVQLKVDFSDLGDQVDTVTLCLNAPFKVTVGSSDAPPNALPNVVAKPGESLALTDVIGRNTTGYRSQRWAFASQLPGSAPQAAYRAMSSIFLQPTSAAAFNGYDHSGDWATYNPTEGLKQLQTVGLQTAFLDRPNQTVDDWRAWTAGAFAPAIRWTKTAGPQPKGGALTNDLFLVNSSGESNNFKLQAGRCLAGDVPILNTPAAVHFIHSLSLAVGADPWTVGGRWLDRGTYVYTGSVEEPLLVAFTTQTTFSQRLAQGWPIAVASRVLPTDPVNFAISPVPPIHPFSAPWRITVVGDALWTLGPALKRSTDAFDLPGSTELSAEVVPFAKARQYAAALDTLAMLGRDDAAARLARAALNDEPEKIDTQAALRAVHAAYRAGDIDTLVKAAQKIDLPDQRDLAVADEIWHALWPLVGSTLNAEQASLLTKTIRPYSYAWDTITAATGLRRAVGNEAARAFYIQSRDKAPRPDIQKELDAAANQFR
jgi:hypothetical protein